MTHGPQQFVLDASVTMAWCFEDEADSYSDGVLDALHQYSAVVPELWMLEVANILLVGERRKRIVPQESDEFIGLLAELPIGIRSLDQGYYFIERIVSSGRETSLSGYDTAYLILAHRLDLPIATKDKGLRKAATQAGVHLFEPSPTK